MDGETVQSSGRDVQEGVARRPGRDQDDGVDDRREDVDAGVGDGDDVRGRFGTGSPGGEARVVARASDADGQDTQDVKDDETVKVTSRGDGEVATGGLHLSTGDDQEFGSEGEWEHG